MKTKNAIVTLNIGRKWEERFRSDFLPAWEVYAEKHGITVVNITRPLDESTRAKSRSPAWQKLLVHKAMEVASFERVAWVDSDIMIRPDAPDIFEACPVDKVAATDDYSTPTSEDHAALMDALYRKWDAKKVPYTSNRTPAEYYRAYGIDCDLRSVVQTGVLVFCPEIHGGLFEKVYQNYEAGSSQTLNHEMRPLSFELLTGGCVQWISTKFNMQWSYYKQLYYPFLDEPSCMEFLRWPKISIREKVLSACVNTAFGNNYFLHFAGDSRDYRFITRTW
jgi:hypothetical protein